MTGEDNLDSLTRLENLLGPIVAKEIQRKLRKTRRKARMRRRKRQGRWGT